MATIMVPNNENELEFIVEKLPYLINMSENLSGNIILNTISVAQKALTRRLA
jgi:hypothetical protein